MSWLCKYYENIYKRFNTCSETSQRRIKTVNQHTCFNSIYPNAYLYEFQRILADKGYKLNKSDAKFLFNLQETQLNKFSVLSRNYIEISNL